MNALVKKEIRLLLPGFLIGVALTFANCFFKESVPAFKALAFNALTSVVSIAACSGIAVFTALNSFGAEISAGTFSMLLAQPVSRHRIWRTKTSLLAAALIIGGFLWCAILYLRFEVFHHQKVLGDFSDILLGTWLFLLVIYSGALWTVLLLRQMAAAFWFTLLTPGAIVVLITGLWPEKYPNACEPAVVAGLMIYSVAGIWFARRLFLRAQDVAWTGGVISLPEWKLFAARPENAVSTRNRKPIFALLKKEFQLHYVTFIGMGGLFLLHFGVVLLRHAHQNPPDYFWKSLDEGLGFFGVLWLVAPLLIGCACVAEEHKFGTMDGQLCLPVSSRVQFAIKFFFTLFFGGLLSVALFRLAETIGVVMGVKNLFFVSDESFGQSAAGILLAFVALPVMAFFASTLTRNILHAMAAAIATAVGFGIIMTVANVVAGYPTVVFGVMLWRGLLVDYIAIPALLAAFVWLAYRNFKSLHENRRLWRRNLFGLTAAVAFSAMLTTGIYHRVWELLTPLEPTHDAARLSVSQSPIIQINNRRALTILFPDGRLWLSRLISRWEPRGNWDKPAGLDGKYFVGSSNWVDVATSYRSIIGIQSDGSLWLAEIEGEPIVLTRNQPLVQNRRPIEMTRFDNETNWQGVLALGEFPLLLKKDGTLWRWGTNHLGDFDYRQNDWQNKWPGLHAFQPYRFGMESNWAGMFSADYGVPYLKKNDGHVWRLLWGTPNTRTNSYEIKPGVWVERNPWDAGHEQTKWQDFYADGRYFQIGIRTNGTMWSRGDLPWTNNLPQAYGRPVQIGSETDWKAVAGRWSALLAVKTDGSLWKWDSESQPNKLSWKRLGNHSDWVAIKDSWGGGMALAADGSLWYWQTFPLYIEKSRHLPPFMLAAPRKPALIGNIFDKQN
jgi:ABC-type transport system involved in multi-copper enzyme maturation permease subunit